ncbi:Crp/Fnr family transcriptional regulator [Fusibacter sp. JL298sf-3]
MEWNELRVVNAFKNLEEDSRTRICEMAVLKRLPQGAMLFHESDHIQHFYAVLKGKVALYRISSNGAKRVFYILGAGDLLNEVVFDDLPVTVDCEIFEDAVVAAFPKEGMRHLMREDFELTMNIMNSLGRKQRRLYRQLKNTVPIGIDKKLAAKLWKLSRDHGTSSGVWQRIDMKLSATYLSYMLGTTRESISRAMKVLKELGALKWEDGFLYVKEADLLTYYRKMK